MKWRKVKVNVDIRKIILLGFECLYKQAIVREWIYLYSTDVQTLNKTEGNFEKV